MINIERFSPAARFARQAVEAGAHFHLPPKSNPHQAGWDRNVDITLTYLFGADEERESNRQFSYEDVGKLFPHPDGRPLGKERIRQIVAKTLGRLYQNAPLEIKQQYDLQNIKTNIGKPQFLTLPQDSIRSILQMIEKGETYRSLRKAFTPTELVTARRSLGEYGVDVPSPKKETGKTSLTKDLEGVREDTDKNTLRQLLARVDRNFSLNYRDTYNQHFISLYRLLLNGGFHFRPDKIGLFLKKLDLADEPYGHIITVREKMQRQDNYYFVFRAQQQRIAKALLSDPDLTAFLTNQVKQVCGVPLKEIPTTTQLFQSGDWHSVGNLCRRLRLRIRKSRIAVALLVKGCSVPILAYAGKRHFYQTADEASLERFLLLYQAKKLGLRS